MDRARNRKRNAVQAAEFQERGRGRRSMDKTMRRTVFLLLFALGLAAGCDWFNDPSPREARVVIDGAAGPTIVLIASSKFVAGVNDVGVTRVEIIQSDTIVTSLPFDRTFNIEGDYRFFIQAARLDADVGSFRMQVFVNEDRKFDEGGSLLEDAPYRFVFQFNQFLTDVIDVTF
jgi:hypothetical protein